MAITNHVGLQQPPKATVTVLMPVSWMHVNAPLSGSNAVSIAYNFGVTFQEIPKVEG